MDPTTHVSVKVLIHNEGRKVLILHKSDKSDPGGVLLDLPGGKVERNESIDDAARREILEETGLRITNLVTVGGYMALAAGRSVLFVVLAARSTGEQVITSHEHISHGWYSIASRLPYSVVAYLRPAIALARGYETGELHNEPI